MAQHKAATSVTIAPVREKSGINEVIDRYWKIAAVVVVVLVGALLYRQVSRTQHEEAAATAWDKLSQATDQDPMTGTLTGPSKQLVAVAEEVGNTPVGPWALYIAAASAAKERDYVQSKALLARLRQEYPTSAPVANPAVAADPGSQQSDADLLEARVDAWMAWRYEHPTLFGLPDLPPDAPRVRINTDRGSIVVGLYADRAPRHAENFRKLAQDGSLHGLKFHRVVSGSLIQSGDPNTLEGEVATWGMGQLGSAQDPEPNDLRAFAGALASASLPGSQASSGSQFTIHLSDNPAPAAGSVVFGKVIEGLDAARAISEAKVVEGTERPEEPATIQSTDVL